MIRLSFILPCYMVEKYIRGCLDSIYDIALPIEEFEVLCFDDHAPDNTPQILDEYATRYPNMHVIHSTENVGPGGGRNALLQHAQGEYIWFVDSDDLVVSNSVQRILKTAEEEQVDVLTFNYREWNFDGTPLPNASRLLESRVDSGRLLANEVFSGGIVHHMGYPVRFLLRREYLIENHILFPERMTFGEDTVWMAKVVLYALKFKTTEEFGYIYWHHEDSTCGELNRSYPGKTIFEKSIITASQLLDFSNELQKLYKTSPDDLLILHAGAIQQYAYSHYVDNLPIMLCRTTYIERCRFYKYLKAFPHRTEMKTSANYITRILLTPYVGPICSHIMAPLYKITHRR